MTAPKTVLSNRSDRYSVLREKRLTASNGSKPATVGIVGLMRPKQPPMPRPIVRHTEPDPELLEGIAEEMRRHVEALERLSRALEIQGLPVIAKDIRKRLGWIEEDISAVFAVAHLERRE